MFAEGTSDATMDSFLDILKSEHDPEFDLFTDCTGVQRGGMAPPKHCGEHLWNLKAVSEQADFAEMAEESKKKAERHFKAFPSKCMEVLMACHQGRHHSDACERFLTEILVRKMNFTASCFHLSRSSWWTHQCFNCRDCRLDCWEQQDHAADMW